jgi:type II secretory pathway component PulF
MEPTPLQAEMARFWRKFLRLTRGRVAVPRALQIIVEESEGALREVAQAVCRDVAAGAELSEAIARHPGHFAPSVRELVRTAEKTGAWDEILVEVADGLAEGTFG